MKPKIRTMFSVPVGLLGSKRMPYLRHVVYAYGDFPCPIWLCKNEASLDSCPPLNIALSCPIRARAQPPTLLRANILHGHSGVWGSDEIDPRSLNALGCPRSHGNPTGFVVTVPFRCFVSSETSCCYHSTFHICLRMVTAVDELLISALVRGTNRKVAFPCRRGIGLASYPATDYALLARVEVQQDRE